MAFHALSKIIVLFTLFTFPFLWWSSPFPSRRISSRAPLFPVGTLLLPKEEDLFPFWRHWRLFRRSLEACSPPTLALWSAPRCPHWRGPFHQWSPWSGTRWRSCCCRRRRHWLRSLLLDPGPPPKTCSKLKLKEKRQKVPPPPPPSERMGARQWWRKRGKVGRACNGSSSVPSFLHFPWLRAPFPSPTLFPSSFVRRRFHFVQARWYWNRTRDTSSLPNKKKLREPAMNGQCPRWAA